MIAALGGAPRALRALTVVLLASAFVLGVAVAVAFACILAGPPSSVFSARCGDGTYAFTNTLPGQCAGHGGVAARLPGEPAAPAPAPSPSPVYPLKK